MQKYKITLQYRVLKFEVYKMRNPLKVGKGSSLGVLFVCLSVFLLTYIVEPMNFRNMAEKEYGSYSSRGNSTAATH